MKRRKFLLQTGMAGMMATLSRVSGKDSGDALDGLFESDDPQVLALGRRVMEKCVLDKIRPPQDPLKHHWIIAGEPHYRGQRISPRTSPTKPWPTPSNTA